ncbi:hypothetical protein [Bacillus sp. V5-8f]|uniref:hypothetical protein n=1 Tax=Bacillus sp. V5-8f TaxID=2053044 RepID=UPI001156D7DC|nr:hypothetical protein [Bacillus sp. V5-8f]
MKNTKKLLAGGLALTLLLSQGVSNADAKGNDKSKKEQKPKVTDKNKNGIADQWEVKYKLSSGKDIANKDNDKDGLINVIEYKLNLNPTSADTDKDKIVDGDEDTDKDGITNGAELDLGLKPDNSDSDNDKIKDGSEVQGKDGVKLSQKIREFKVDVKTSHKKSIQIQYKLLKNKTFVQVKDKTGTVTKEMVESLVKDLQASSTLTKEDIISKVQAFFKLDNTYKIDAKVKYLSGKHVEIDKEVKVEDKKEEEDKADSGKNQVEESDDEDHDDEDDHDQE